VAEAMVKQKILPEAGHFYHVYNRGNNHQPIFFERENYLYFLRLIRQNLVINGVDLAAYCLMPNHYHLQGKRISKAIDS
jgi:REP element-mobilizing transposase RayT